MKPLEGSVPSPNIWHHTETYELENRSVDQEQVIESAMRDLLGGSGWRGLDVLDLGCGTGFHLPRWAVEARSVVGVEPHPDLLALRWWRFEADSLLGVDFADVPAAISQIRAREEAGTLVPIQRKPVRVLGTPATKLFG